MSLDDRTDEEEMDVINGVHKAVLDAIGNFAEFHYETGIAATDLGYGGIKALIDIDKGFFGEKDPEIWHQFLIDALHECILDEEMKKNG